MSEKEPSVYQKAINELLIGLEAKEEENKILQKEIQQLKDNVERLTPLISSLADRMKMDYIIENWNRITQSMLEALLKN